MTSAKFSFLFTFSSRSTSSSSLLLLLSPSTPPPLSTHPTSAAALSLELTPTTNKKTQPKNAKKNEPGKASDKCQREKRKTINGDDLLWALSTLGFECYVDPLKAYLAKYRESEKNAMAAGGGGKAGRKGRGRAPTEGRLTERFGSVFFLPPPTHTLVLFFLSFSQSRNSRRLFFCSPL